MKEMVGEKKHNYFEILWQIKVKNEKKKTY
jgi:hypothetical protein